LGNGHEVFRVLRPEEPTAQDMIVTGAFSFDAQSLRGHPGKGIEPMQCASHMGDQLGQAVEPLHVG